MKKITFKPIVGLIIFTVLLFFPIFAVLMLLTDGYHIDCAVDTWQPYCGFHPPLFSRYNTLVMAILSLVSSYLIVSLIYYLYNKSKQLNNKPKQRV